MSCSLLFGIMNVQYVYKNKYIYHCRFSVLNGSTVSPYMCLFEFIAWSATHTNCDKVYQSFFSYPVSLFFLPHYPVSTVIHPVPLSFALSQTSVFSLFTFRRFLQTQTHTPTDISYIHEIYNFYCYFQFSAMSFTILWSVIVWYKQLFSTAIYISSVYVLTQVKRKKIYVPIRKKNTHTDWMSTECVRVYVYIRTFLSLSICKCSQA